MFSLTYEGAISLPQTPCFGRRKKNEKSPFFGSTKREETTDGTATWWGEWKVKGRPDVITIGGSCKKKGSSTNSGRRLPLKGGRFRGTSNCSAFVFCVVDNHTTKLHLVHHTSTFDLSIIESSNKCMMVDTGWRRWRPQRPCILNRADLLQLSYVLTVWLRLFSALSSRRGGLKMRNPLWRQVELSNYWLKLPRFRAPQAARRRKPLLCRMEIMNLVMIDHQTFFRFRMDHHPASSSSTSKIDLTEGLFHSFSFEKLSWS